MKKLIRISAGEVSMAAELNNSQTAALIYDKLPLEGTVNTWGDEIYFKIPVESGPEDAVEKVEIGDLAYWPDGQCFCIFFGKTPASTDSEIRPASPVNLIGRFTGNPDDWKKVHPGVGIKLQRGE